MNIQRIRYEHFGGIVATTSPVGLFWVDRQYLMNFGYHGGAAWSGDDPGYLRGPLEVEIHVTSACNLACSLCYTDSGPGLGHVPYDRLVSYLDFAARVEALHVAFGGGEPLLHPRLLDLAAAARHRGLLPATTTNGTLVTPDWVARAAGLWARVNVSIDAGGGPRDPRAGLTRCLQAVTCLRSAGVDAGVNIVLTRQNLQQLPELFAMSAEAGADSVLVLRPKPVGRGGSVYAGLKPAATQLSGLVSALMDASSRASLPFHVDCALAPLVLSSECQRETLDTLGAAGCIAGDLLLTVDSAGTVRPCSHTGLAAGHTRDYPAAWHVHPTLVQLRGRAERLGGRCQNCDVRDLCRGGCLAVNEHYGLSWEAPDPDLSCSVRPHRVQPPPGAGRARDGVIR